MGKDEFFIRVAHAMGGCHAVEQGLKLYLTEAFEAVRLRVAPRRGQGIARVPASGQKQKAVIDRFLKINNQLR